MHSVRAFLLLTLAMTSIAACGGSSSSPSPAVPGPTGLQVGGQYATDVSLLTNTCTGITVQSNPTTVSHTAGASTLVVTHAGLSYNGTIQTSGAFTTSPTAVTAGSATHTLSIVGQFSRTGFDATVTANVTQSTDPKTCQYTVKWVGTKQGGTNTIP